MYYFSSAGVAKTCRHLSQGLLHLLLPSCCQLCHRPLPEYLHHFCDTCRTSIFQDGEEVCPRCAGTVGAFTIRDGCCRHCKNESYAFDRVVRLGSYDGALRDAVLKIKNSHHEGLAELLGETWVESRTGDFQAFPAEMVVPVPLHWRRRWQRGYNQSAALAWGLAHRLGLPLVIRALRRTNNSPSQTTQS